MSDACPLNGCAVNCASYNVCSNNVGCVANEVACPSNTIDDQTAVGPSPDTGSEITNEILQAMRDVVDTEFTSTSRRASIDWQPSPPTVSDFIQDTEIDGGVSATDYWTAMANKLSEQAYANGPVSNIDNTGYTTPAYISYQPNGDISYDTDKLITGSMIVELYNAINMLVTDCVCYSNACTCNQICNCNTECGCNGHY